MDKRKLLTVAGIGIAMLIMIISVIVMVVNRLTPSDEIKPLNEHYSVNDGEVLLFMENYIYEKRGLIFDNTVYVDYETVESAVNHRMYWDAKENVLLYTTPTEVIKASVGEKKYYINKSEVTTEYTIVKSTGDQVYVALPFIKEFSNLEYKEFDNPKRVIFSCNWGKEFLYADAQRVTAIRVEADIKSPILQDVEDGAKLVYTPDMESKGGFSKVMTEEGVIGYVREKYISESYHEKMTNDYVEPEYPSIHRNDKINMVWHQVFKKEANDSLLELLESTKGVNVISPTWFTVINNNGDISSLANEKYVERAHNAGIEVWALIADFGDNVSVDMKEVLSYTSKREKLINALISEVIKYNIDGINIDFEKIPSEAGRDFIQFIRELSIKCRGNSIVLSVDNYVPMQHTAFYDREEQGKIVDYVITMAYDEHYAGSKEAGSVSSISYVQNAVDKIAEQVPENKIIMALPFYSRLWKETGTGDNIELSSEAYSMVKAEKILKDEGAEASWNEEVAQNYAQFEKDGATYRIWLEDEESYKYKLEAVFSKNIAGVAAWKLGLEKAQIWDLIAKYIN